MFPTNIAEALELLARALRSRCIWAIILYAVTHGLLAPLALTYLADPITQALIGLVEWLLLGAAAWYRMRHRAHIHPEQPPEGGPRPAQ